MTKRLTAIILTCFSVTLITAQLLSAQDYGDGISGLNYQPESAILSSEHLSERFVDDAQRTVNPGTALLRSFILPGWGQYYVDSGNWRRGQVHLGAEVVLITSWIYLHTNANLLENNMYSFAQAYAGIDIRNASRVVEIAVAGYDSIHDYNEFQLRSRNWDRLLDETPANMWAWDSRDHRIEYISLRNRMDRLRQQVPGVVTLMVVNRLLSGINAFVIARRYNENLPDLSFSVPQDTGGQGFQANLRFSF